MAAEVLSDQRFQPGQLEIGPNEPKQEVQDALAASALVATSSIPEFDDREWRSQRVRQIKAPEYPAEYLLE